jgi:SET domain-containing protein
MGAGCALRREHEVKYVVDAAEVGGVARYLNHSCNVRTPASILPPLSHPSHAPLQGHPAHSQCWLRANEAIKCSRPQAAA